MNKICNLSLSGGGNFVFAHVGALAELEKYPEYISVQNISAVSCGSIVAALYAVGYTTTELKEIFFNLEWDKLLCGTSNKYRSLYNNYGLYEATDFEAEIDRLISAKTNIKNCTFCQLKKNLTIIATNLNYQKPAYFNKDFSPEMIISKAVRMSIAYPILITPVLYNGDYYGDGGEFMHYPITIFDNLSETIGITFMSHDENLDGTLKTRNSIDSVYDYIKAVATTMSRSMYVSQITPEYLSRSIIVNIPEKIDSTQFNPTLEQKKIIYEAGTNAVIDQIDKIIRINK